MAVVGRWQHSCRTAKRGLMKNKLTLEDVESHSQKDPSVKEPTAW